MDLKEKQHLHLKGIGDDNKVRFYTGFATLSVLMVCFNFLGESINKFHYWASTSGAVEAQTKTSKGWKRILPPLEVFPCACLPAPWTYVAGFGLPLRHLLINSLMDF